MTHEEAREARIKRFCIQNKIDLLPEQNGLVAPKGLAAWPPKSSPESFTFNKRFSIDRTLLLSERSVDQNSIAIWNKYFKEDVNK